MWAETLWLVLLNGEAMIFAIPSDDGSVAGLRGHVANTFGVFRGDVVFVDALDRLAGLMVSNLLSTPRHPIADGASWRDMVRDILAHRYRAAAQTEAYLDIQCVSAKDLMLLRHIQAQVRRVSLSL